MYKAYVCEINIQTVQNTLETVNLYEIKFEV